jgi:peroxiredoxin
MSRFSRFASFVAAAVVAASCGRTASVEAVIADAASSDVVVKLLDVNRFEVLDTVKVDSNGKLSYKVSVEKGQPEFVYLFHNDKKVASLILQDGDKVSVTADTLGNYTVEGSEESVKLAQIEKEYAEVISKVTSIAYAIQDAKKESEANVLRQELGKTFVEYYRSRVKYVMENPYSLSVIPVFYQNLSPELPVFGQATDAIHFRNAVDSLSTVYPESKYVKALAKEADKRFGYLELQSRIMSADAVGYPEINLPDIKGEKSKLSEVDAKVVMVHFWTASSAEQKMFNLDVLKPLYEEFHSKGFEIYQVSLDVDKVLWAQVVKEQKLPWISVCDSRGSASPYVPTYNVAVLPAFYIIANGELVDGSVVDDKSLRATIQKLVK